MLTREERAKAEELFGRNPDATMKDVEQTLGRRPDGMVDALELDILRSRAKDEAKAAKAAGAKPEAAKDDAKPAGAKPEAAKAAEEAKADEAEEPFARVLITVEMTMRGKDDFALTIHSGPAEVSDEESRMLRVKTAILKLVAHRACDRIGDLMDAAWVDRATKDAVDELAKKLGLPKDA